MGARLPRSRRQVASSRRGGSPPARPLRSLGHLSALPAESDNSLNPSDPSGPSGPLNIAIIVGSTQPRRNGAAVAAWVHERAAARTMARYEVVDLEDVTLPLLDEAVPALAGQYEHQHTRDWAATVARFDGFVFVTPEYNHSTSGRTRCMPSLRVCPPMPGNFLQSPPTTACSRHRLRPRILHLDEPDFPYATVQVGAPPRQTGRPSGH
jgi:hypothetical protein